MSRRAAALPFVVLFLVSSAHLLLAPFTKVEESFNVQAVHDLLYTSELDDYDHLEFPGPVPRTFVPSLLVAFAAKPFKLLHILGIASKVTLLIISRMLLSIMVAVGLCFFFSKVVSDDEVHIGRKRMLFALLSAIQFHLPFYMSRMLPNVIALVPVSFGLGFWMQQSKPSSSWKASICILTFAAIVCRCDVIILTGIVGIHMVTSRRVPLLHGLWFGAVSVCLSLLITILVDSHFWGRWLWPEGEVLYFNTVLNKSKEWGVSPFYWYFTSALPRMLNVAYPAAFLGALVDSRARRMTIVALCFVFLYSFLGHKELRFLFPTLPLWNLSAALGLDTLFFKSKNSTAISLLRLAVLGGCFLGVSMTIVSSKASYLNYPGGLGLVEAKNLIRMSKEIQSEPVVLHIDTYAAMTGVSRFLQEPKVSNNEKILGNNRANGTSVEILYSKEEGLELDEYQTKGFDYLLNEHAHVPGYHMVKTIEGFHGIKFHGRSMKAALLGMVRQVQSPITYNTAPVLFVHRLYS